VGEEQNEGLRRAPVAPEDVGEEQNEGPPQK